MSNTSTPFPLGFYIGNPNGGDPAAEAVFEQSDKQFSQLMGAQPQFIDAYVDQTQPISQWTSNASWAAWSNATSPVTKGMTPVIGLPMTSTAAGSPTADQTYKNFASGMYDGMLAGVVKSWADQGFTTQYWRPGWEMNLSDMPSFAGNDAATQADWISAFQHIYTVLHTAGAADGVKLQVIWNPGIMNYAAAGPATTTAYPGAQYVDVIGADMYSDLYPYGGPNAIYDWAKNNGTIDTSLQTWAANPLNLAHYWSYPAATQWSLDGSQGHSLSLQNLIDFAKQQGKPFAVAETGAGGTGDGAGVSDDPAFPQWLATTLTNAGVPIDFVNIWDSNGGGNYEFSAPSDGKPLEAAAWAKYFGASAVSSGSSGGTAPVSPTPVTVSPVPVPVPVTVTPAPAPSPINVGSGSDTIALLVSEDAWQGDAQFTVSIDGTQVGGTLTATASHGAGLSQTVNILATLAGGSHTVGVTFLNDAYGGTAQTDRNLYVNSATMDGAAIAGSPLSLLSNGQKSLTFSKAVPIPVVPIPVVPVPVVPVPVVPVPVVPVPVVPVPVVPASAAIGSGPDTLALAVSEDAWLGDAQFTVSVDGAQVGGVQTATASHASGQSQTLNVMGSFAGAHSVAVNFLNDAYGGSASTDRNLYVNSSTIDGTAIAGGSLTELSDGAQSIAFSGPTSTAVNVGGSGPDTITLKVAEDAYQGDAQFTISLNGTQIGGVQTATASNAAGATQSFVAHGTLGPSNTLQMTFLNDQYGSTGDRNLYIKSTTVDGTTLANGAINESAAGAQNLYFGPNGAAVAQPSGSMVNLNVAEDYYAGDAQYTVSVDGGPVSAVQTTTAHNNLGQMNGYSLGVLGVGTHDVAVDFLNDAWGGSASTDRNLYVPNYTVANVNHSASMALYSSGTQHLSIVVPSH